MTITLHKPSLGEEEINSIKKVLDSRWLGLGLQVKEFEDEVKKFLGAKFLLAVNSGTAALHISLDAFGVGPGDEVIVPSFTFIATIQAILYCGAIPVFCDIYPDTLNTDIEDVRSKLTKKTKVIMPVHYGGLPCRMDDLLEIAKKNKILIVEDAAHAFGSAYKGKKIGTFGDATCFSFDPIKNITCGEGGAVATNNEKIFLRMQKKRVLGIDKDINIKNIAKSFWPYEITISGYRYHMNNINAAIGLVQLKKFNEFMRKKRMICQRYDQSLREIPALGIFVKNYEEIAPFNYVIKVSKNRDKLMSFLRKKGIETGIHYIPNHLQPFLRKYHRALPVTEKIYKQILTLPLYSEMSENDAGMVIVALKDFFKK